MSSRTFRLNQLRVRWSETSCWSARLFVSRFLEDWSKGSGMESWIRSSSSKRRSSGISQESNSRPVLGSGTRLKLGCPASCFKLRAHLRTAWLYHRPGRLGWIYSFNASSSPQSSLASSTPRSRETGDSGLFFKNPYTPKVKDLILEKLDPKDLSSLKPEFSPFLHFFIGNLHLNNPASAPTIFTKETASSLLKSMEGWKNLSGLSFLLPPQESRSADFFHQLFCELSPFSRGKLEGEILRAHNSSKPEPPQHQNQTPRRQRKLWFFRWKGTSFLRRLKSCGKNGFERLWGLLHCKVSEIKAKPFR